MSVPHLGDFGPWQTVHFMWNSFGATGASITRATNGTISVYKNVDDTQDTSGITDTEDADSTTGVHRCAIDLTSDTTFYAPGANYMVVLTGATIDGVTINAALATFSILNRSENAGMIYGQVNDAAPAVGDFDCDRAPTNLSTTADFYKNGVMEFVTGTLAGLSRRITAWSTGRNATFSGTSGTPDEPWPTAPADNDWFRILGIIGEEV